jgi:hypothetical protein
MDAAIFHQILVQLLQVTRGQFGELDLSDSGDGIGFDHQVVSVSGGDADVGLGVEVVPGAQPGGYGVFFCADYIQVLGLIQDF